jgi:hypothetical protein
VILPMVIREVTERSLVEFVREQIAEGCTALSRVISRSIDLSIGGFFLIMPSDLLPERVEDWNWDPGHYKWQEADKILAHIIGAYLQNAENRVVIQDFEQRRTDPHSHFEDDPLRVSYGEELYWEVQGLDVSEAKIEECVGDASYWPWLSYFCKTRPARSKFITDADLKEVAAHLVGVGVQALHDSYVVWWRTDLEPFPSTVSTGNYAK